MRTATLIIFAIGFTMGLALGTATDARASGAYPVPYPNNQPPGPVTANPAMCSALTYNSPDAGLTWCSVFPKNTCLRVAAGFTANLNYRKGFLADAGATALASDMPLAATVIEKSCLVNLYVDGGSDFMPDAGGAVCFLLSAAAPEAGASTCP